MAGFSFLVLITAGYAYRSTTQNQSRWNRAQEFNDKLAEYRELRERTNNSSSSNGKEPLENPLSYLENQVQQSNLGGLSPLGESNGRNRYQLSLEAVPAARVFELIRLLDQRGGLNIVSVRIERITLDKNQFDAQFRLEEMGS